MKKIVWFTLFVVSTLFLASQAKAQSYCYMQFGADGLPLSFWQPYCQMEITQLSINGQFMVVANPGRYYDAGWMIYQQRNFAYWQERRMEWVTMYGGYGGGYYNNSPGYYNPGYGDGYGQGYGGYGYGGGYGYHRQSRRSYGRGYSGNQHRR